MEIVDEDCNCEAVAKLHRNAPFLIHGVSRSMFSVARFSGGITYNVDSFLYQPATDTLVRSDVVKAVARSKKKRKAK